jgi:hypothetical protein
MIWCVQEKLLLQTEPAKAFEEEMEARLQRLEARGLKVSTTSRTLFLKCTFSSLTHSLVLILCVCV